MGAVFCTKGRKGSRKVTLSFCPIKKDQGLSLVLSASHRSVGLRRFRVISLTTPYSPLQTGVTTIDPRKDRPIQVLADTNIPKCHSAYAATVAAFFPAGSVLTSGNMERISRKGSWALSSSTKVFMANLYPVLLSFMLTLRTRIRMA